MDIKYRIKLNSKRIQELLEVDNLSSDQQAKYHLKSFQLL